MPQVSAAPQGQWINGKFVLPPAVAATLAAAPGGAVPPSRPAVVPVGRTTTPGGAPQLGGGNPVPSNLDQLVAAAAPKQSEIPSASGAITNSDHSPSLYGRFVEGDKGGENNAEWAAKGGPSVATSLAVGGMEQTADLLGVKAPQDIILKTLGLQHHATDNVDEWGSVTDNAQTAKANDYNEYFNRYGLQGAMDGMSDRARQMVLGSFDVNQDGQVQPGEFGQWHWQTYGQNEGRSINPVNIPKTPTPGDLSAGRTTGASSLDQLLAAAQGGSSATNQAFAPTLEQEQAPAGQGTGLDTSSLMALLASQGVDPEMARRLMAYS